MLKIGLIGTDWNTNTERKTLNTYGGVSYYRLIKPLLVLDSYETKFYNADMSERAKGKTTEQFWTELISECDLFITKCIDNPEAASNLIFFARNAGKKVILDLDDNMFEVKQDNPAYEQYKVGGEKRHIVSALISLVDGLFVSTEPLAAYYKKHLQDVYNVSIPIFVLPNYNDVNDFNYIPVPKKKNKTVIGWTGSVTHFNDLKLVLPAMERLLKEYRDLEFSLVGGLTEADAIKLFSDIDESVLSRIFVEGGTLSWEGYPKLLSNLAWDIAIAPVTDDEFNRGKSWIKWLEMSMYKIPVVASKVYPYYRSVLGQRAIIDGETGFLADPHEWYEKLKSLIDSEELRNKIGENAYEYIAKNLQYDQHRNLWCEALSNFE